MNDTICRDCDKLGNCTMKCAALKKLRTPYLIRLSARGHGGMTHEEILAALRASEIGVICPAPPEYVITPLRTNGAAIALNICGRGQVLRDIVRIKHTEKELIFIDSKGHENHVAKKLIDTMEVIT